MYRIELPRELLRRLAELREKTGKPIAVQVREAVQAYCERVEEDRPESRQPDSEGAVSK